MLNGPKLARRKPGNLVATDVKGFLLRNTIRSQTISASFSAYLEDLFFSVQ